ncbi:MAG: GNVR domain-containing protein [Vicinamibacterales bacterium]
MLPGKTFSPEEVLLILRRRIWYILVPFAIISAATAIYVRRLPNVYRSSALIAVTPPKVSESVVRSTVASVKIEDRIPAIKNEILSRTLLERIIQDFNLYPNERRVEIMQDIVERMVGQIGVDPVGGSAIRVRFDSPDPVTAQRVAQRLSALFMDQSNRVRKNQVENTDQFLQLSVKSAEDRLVEKEKALQLYRQQHNGELPDQQSSNLQAAQNQQLQIQAFVTEINRASERRVALEKAIQDIESRSPSDSEVSAPAGSTAQQLNQARARLLDLQVTKRADHPEVQQMAKIVRDLQAKLDSEAREAPLSASSKTNPAEAARQRQLEEARAQLEQLDKQTKANQESLAATRERAAEYLRRAEAAPVRQTEMTSLTRDYNTIGQLYTGLLTQKEQSTIAASMERREIGEQYTVIDQPVVPGRPSSPNRSRMNLMGMAVGLALGVGLAGLLEYRDSTFRTDDDLVRVMGMPVLAVVPLMQSEVERRRTFQWKVAWGTVLGGGVLGCLAIVVYTFVR